LFIDDRHVSSISFEQARQEVNDEFERQQVARAEYKRQQANEQTQRIRHRQEQDIDKAQQILDAKREIRGGIIDHNHHRYCR
jgi:hypothetical protein